MTVTLVVMILAHLVADYTLQGWLADGKQKSWWRKACGGEVPDKYRNDYKAALLCHSIYWSILVCAPLCSWDWFFAAVAANSAVHYFVDDLKANKLKINLVQDQLCHLGQILLTLGAFAACEAWGAA